MLAQLFINNIAVIERASIELDQGFTVLTGETGAGKSIIIDAIHAVLGERTSKELVRTGTDTASVSALFVDLDQDTLKALDEMSIPREEDNSLLIQREIRLEGRSLCKLNGVPATVSMLRELGTRLISIHGQHESYELLSPEVHMTYVDSFGGLEKLLEEYQESYRKLRRIQQKLESFNTDEGEKARRLDLLRYQIDELEAADIQPGEREELTRQRDAMRNSEKIAASLEIVRDLLIGDENANGLLSGVSQAVSEMERAAEFLSDAEEPTQKLRDAKYLLEDVDSALQSMGVEFDPALQETVEDRLDLLYRLSLKYGDTEEKMLAFLENAQKEIHEIEFSDEARAELESQYEAEKKQAITLAKQLSERRKAAGKTFVEMVKQELGFLNMPGIEFLVEMERVPLYAMGCDKMQFLVSANKGEPPKPMSKIASGGELSRIMLAIKTVLSGKDKVETLIFDEVDTGISGAAANKVGQKLKQVSQNRQVLCITHLAQIAALADNHFQISKHVEKERTFTDVKLLDFEGRKQELARIIGGENVTDLQLKMAEEMLKST
ncbi:DNA repair protein RecN [uncultured Neglectibacter sp.]|uniref:DNA repair protein RecN n=1 Tax=uncultured Neglectibacter sp. TaxID=1924108 RepID=UPI0034DF52C2